MGKDFQKTIKESVELQGIGLHNGKEVNIILNPTKANSGIRFKRTDVDYSKSIIEANYNNVKSPVLCTKIQNSFGISQIDQNFRKLKIF